MSLDPAAPNPYPGLRPFQADETELYFGRDEQRIELLHRLRLTRLLAIVGTSGSGKSSLVWAGLLPGLHGGFMAGRSASWRIVDMRPGTNAIANLASALDRPGALRDTPDSGGPSFTEATLRRSGLGLVEVVREARLPDGENLLVLVDQFEELFRAIDTTDLPQTGDDASAFIKLLLEAARQPALPIYIVLTMRSDFLGECARFRDLPEALNNGQYLVPRLTHDQRTEAIVGSAAMFGVTLSSALLNRVLNDVGENPDQLPILQHALMRTWAQWQQRPPERAASRVIELADYLQVGGMAQALSQHANAVFDGLGAGRSAEAAQRRQAIAERLFKRLAGTGAGGRLVRRLASVQEVADVAGASPAEVIEVVEAFRAPGNSFLMPPAGEPLGPQQYLDISHESLIRNWSKFIGWVDTQVTPPRSHTGWVEQEAESARVYERLSSTALLASKQQAALWVQPDLGVALQWRDTQQPNRAWSLRYNSAFEPAMAFLAASQAKAQATEDRNSRRRRTGAMAVALTFALMLTGSLNWLKDELSAADKMVKQAQETSTALQQHRALVQLYQVRLAGGSTAAPAQACEMPGPPGAPSASPDALSARLCDPSHTLTAADQAEALALEQVIDGRWVEASTRLNGPAVDGSDLALARELLNRLATTRSPADRYERGLLRRLAALPSATDPEQAPGTQQTRVEAGRLSHPVHQRIGQLLAREGQTALNEEEQKLLDAYENAEQARSDGGSNTQRENSTARATALADELRRRPHGAAYADLAMLALKPESRVIEFVQTSAYYLRDWAWLIGIVMVWPAWRLRRWLQRRQPQAIPARPNHLRRVAAHLVDFTVAGGLALLAGGLVSALLGIGHLLARGAGGTGWINDSGGAAGTLAACAWLLCRDALKLRYRRSIGMALFDLRPLCGAGPDAGAVGLRVSLRRNAVLMLIALLLLGAGLTVGTVGVLLAAPLSLLLFPLFNYGWTRWHQGQTWIDQRSGTRVVDADSAESLAARP